MFVSKKSERSVKKYIYIKNRHSAPCDQSGGSMGWVERAERTEWERLVQERSGEESSGRLFNSFHMFHVRKKLTCFDTF